MSYWCELSLQQPTQTITLRTPLKKIITNYYFENPFKSIQDVHKEVIKYKRDDGLELSGTL